MHVEPQTIPRLPKSFRKHVHAEAKSFRLCCPDCFGEPCLEGRSLRSSAQIDSKNWTFLRTPSQPAFVALLGKPVVCKICTMSSRWYGRLSANQHHQNGLLSTFTGEGVICKFERGFEATKVSRAKLHQLQHLKPWQRGDKKRGTQRCSQAMAGHLIISPCCSPIGRPSY